VVSISSTITVNRRELANFTGGGNSGVVRYAERLGRRIESTAKRFAPVDEGLLRASISHTVTRQPSRVVVQVRIGVRYGIYISKGTGIYGPKHTRITPRTAKALRFEVRPGRPLRRGQRTRARGSRPVVYAASVRGTPFNHFMVRALRAHVPNVTSFV
jgi:hypothetical protein